jgi:hypothetical protein
MHEYLTTPEILVIFQDVFGAWASHNISLIAAREGWVTRRMTEKYTHTNLYRAIDVAESAHARRRTGLAKRLGWKPGARKPRLIWHDVFDIECPICGAFAVEYSRDSEIQAIGIPPWLCVAGHSHLDLAR